MKINPQSFFNFCANHASLLRGLAERGGEISEAEARRLIRANPSAVEEMAETAWRRLRELQILVPSENMGTEEKRRADRGRRSPNASRRRWQGSLIKVCAFVRLWYFKTITRML